MDAQVDDKAMLFTAAVPQLTDPFLMLADDLFSSPGFTWHPHRGLEAVTLVLDGVLEHSDNTGHAGTLTAGDVDDRRPRDHPPRARLPRRARPHRARLQYR